MLLDCHTSDVIRFAAHDFQPGTWRRLMGQKARERWALPLTLGIAAGWLALLAPLLPLFRWPGVWPLWLICLIGVTLFWTKRYCVAVSQLPSRDIRAQKHAQQLPLQEVQGLGVSPLPRQPVGASFWTRPLLSETSLQAIYHVPILVRTRTQTAAFGSQLSLQEKKWVVGVLCQSVLAAQSR